MSQTPDDLILVGAPAAPAAPAPRLPRIRDDGALLPMPELTPRPTTRRVAPVPTPPVTAPPVPRDDVPDDLKLVSLPATLSPARASSVPDDLIVVDAPPDDLEVVSLPPGTPPGLAERMPLRSTPTPYGGETFNDAYAAQQAANAMLPPEQVEPGPPGRDAFETAYIRQQQINEANNSERGIGGQFTAGVDAGLQMTRKGVAGLADISANATEFMLPGVVGQYAAAPARAFATGMRDVANQQLRANQGDPDSTAFKAGSVVVPLAGFAATGGAAHAAGAGAVGTAGAASLIPAGEQYTGAIEAGASRGVATAEAATTLGTNTALFSALGPAAAMTRGASAPVRYGVAGATGAAGAAGAGFVSRKAGEIGHDAPAPTLEDAKWDALMGAVLGTGFQGARDFSVWFKARGQSKALGPVRPAGKQRQPGEMSIEEAASVLGVAPDAPPAEILKAAHRAWTATHPDRGGTQEAFERVTRAKNTLKPRPVQEPQPAQQQRQPAPEPQQATQRPQTPRQPPTPPNATEATPAATARPQASQVRTPSPPNDLRIVSMPPRPSPQPSRQQPPARTSVEAENVKLAEFMSGAKIAGLSPADRAAALAEIEAFDRSGRPAPLTPAVEQEPSPVSEEEWLASVQKSRRPAPSPQPSPGVPAPSDLSLRDLEGATPIDPPSRRLSPVGGEAAQDVSTIVTTPAVAPPAAPTPAKEHLVSAVVRANGKEFEGATHGDASDAAIASGDIRLGPDGQLLDRAGNDIAPTGDADLFKTSTGRIVSRADAGKVAGVPHAVGEHIEKYKAKLRSAPTPAKSAPLTDDDLPQRQPTQAESFDPDEPLITRDERDALNAPLGDDLPAPAPPPRAAIEQPAVTRDDGLRGGAAEEAVEGNSRPRSGSAVVAAEGAPALATGQAGAVAAKPAAAAAEVAVDVPEAHVASSVAGKLTQQQPIVLRDAIREADQHFGGTMAQGKYTPKDLSDAIELGVNQHIRESGKFDPREASVSGAVAAVHALDALTSTLPTQTRRTDEQVQFQQFSTPPAYAYAANWVANLRPDDVMLEPSAGTGGLAVFGMNGGARVVGNELSERRAKLLKALGVPEVHQENAEQIANILAGRVKPTVVVMNPPFSQTAGRMGDKKVLGTAATHIEQALKLLPPGGRLVAIVGRGMASNSPTHRQWFARMAEQGYTLRASVGVSGDVYKKYGTSFGTRVLVFDKIPATGQPVTTAEVGNLVELVNALKGVRDARPASQLIPAEPGLPEAAREGDAGRPADGRRPVPVATDDMGGGAAGAVDGGSEPAASAGRPAVRPEPAAPVEGDAGAVPGESRADAGGRAADRVDDAAGGGQVPPRTPRPRKQSDVTVTETEQEKSTAPMTEAVFENYRPQRVRIEGAKQHPTKLVQSAAMASVQPPAPTYTPNLPKKIIDEGKLTDAQLEQIVYAGQAHEQLIPHTDRRRGYFIGDGTGVGKGATIAGIILDNFNQGRNKAVWISKNFKLLQDAKRDWSWVGGDLEKLIPQKKIKAGEPIQQKDGILFTGYGTIKTDMDGPKSRVKQIVEWVGKDFDGVIVFDEAHKMKNALEVKGARGQTEISDTAAAALDLQKQLPKARIVYSSATGATEVHNLVYAERLGLWGPGTAFGDAKDFVSQIHSGGVAAMELVARDMKQLGLYMARELSYDGVEYEPLTHTLSDDQRTIYNKLTEGWQIVLNNMMEALKVTAGVQKPNGDVKIDGKAKGKAMSAFWGAHQRFFSQIITSMQMPSVLKDVERTLAEGKSAVLQLVNTNAASQDRSIAAMGDEDELENLDLTPRDQLMQLVEHSFPTQQYEQYVDDNGNTRMRAVVDSKGNPVQSAQAVRMRDKLLTEIASIRVPDGPLEMLLNHFGVDQVAEVTGRSRRVVRVKENGKEKSVLQKLSEQKALADAAAFQAGKKRVLVFSDAGGTGASYHADVKAKNQQQRVHYLVQPGWVAEAAVQGFGRTHRSGEVNQPLYKLVSTDLKGQKRFISTIARRLGQLGALTRGQRQAGSSGMFKETDNLESSHARDALRSFYNDLSRGQIEGLTLQQFEKETGLRLTQESGGLRQDLPPVPQFLNRLLSLSIDTQNRVFDEFADRFERIVEQAHRTGQLDVGVETLKADRVEKVHEQTVYTEPRTQAETKHVAVNLKHKNKPTDFEKAQRPVGRNPFLFFARNRKSGKVYAFHEGALKTNTSTGSIEEQYHQTGPLRRETVSRREIDDAERWEKLDKDAAQSLWDEQLRKVPEFREERIDLITGSVLPIWDKLRGQTRVFRLQTDAGERILGRVVPADELAATLKNLGASGSAPQLTPTQAVTKVLDDGATLRLANDWTIRRRNVNGEDRIEIVGANFSHFDNLKAMGAFTETHQFKTSIFLPTGDNAAEVMGKLLEQHPVVDVVNRERGGGGRGSTFGRFIRDESGFISADVMKPVAVVVQAGGQAVKTVADFAVRDVVDRVRGADTPTAKQAAELGDAAVNSAKAALGKLSKPLDSALTVLGSIQPSRQRATFNLQRVQRPPGKDYGVSRLVDAVEGRALSLSPAEIEAVRVIQHLTDATGQMLKANGVQQQRRDGSWGLFNYVPGGRVFVRHPTPDGFGILMGGPKTAGWSEWIDAIADMNAIPRAQVENVFFEQRDALIGEGPQSAFHRISGEFTRAWKRVPTHLFVGGDEIPVLHTQPFMYAKYLAENTAARVGFIKHFGQEIKPGNLIETIRRDFARETGDAGPVVDMMRALNGVPLETPIVAAGTPGGQVLRAVRGVESLLKSGLLSLSTIQNLAEPLGSLQGFGGGYGADFLKALWKLSAHPQATIAGLEQLGAITKDVADLAFQPERPLESVTRILREASSRVFLHRYVNELQEKLAAAIAAEKVERMQAGKGGDGEVFDLVRFGWSTSNAKRLAAGKGTQAEYNKFIRQAGAKLVGSPMSAAERTRLSHNRIYRAAVAFEQYAQMKVRSFLKEAEAYAKIASDTQFGRKNPRLFFSAHVKWARYLFGTAAAGAVGYFLMALATGGELGLEIAVSEAKDRPVRFLRDSWLYATFAGPYGAVIRNTSKNGGMEDWVRATLPGFLIGELGNAVMAEGSYRGKTAVERMSAFGGRVFPVSKLFTTAKVAMGFGNKGEHEYETARRAYWRWRFDEKPPGKFTPGEIEKEQRQFRDQMYRAHDAMQRGDDPTPFVEAALNMEGKEGRNLAASIRAKQMLTKMALQAASEQEAEELRDKLRSRIGERAYEIIEAHDQLLAEWAESLVLSEDAASAAHYREKYGARLVDLERRKKAAPEQTPERAELESRSRTIDRESREIRKAPIPPEEKRRHTEQMLDATLIPMPAK